MCITDGLRKTWEDHPEGRRWLADHETLKREAASRWGLRVGPLFPGSNVSFVWPATLGDGTRVVLKLNFPEPETEHEPDALRHWRGRGAVRLIDDDPGLRALLMERCEPGHSLDRLPEADAMAAAAEILRLLRIPPPTDSSFRRLDGLAIQWAHDIHTRWERLGQPFEQELLDHAIGRIGELVATATEEVVLHQDLHAGNILRAEGDRWLAIDPKPLVGDPAFDTASLLRDRRDELLRDPDRERRVRRRVDQLAAALALDRERIVGWGIAHALAWGTGNDGVDDGLVSCARLLMIAAPGHA